MVFKKKTKLEELQEELKEVTHEMKVAFKQAKKYSRKGEMGKSLQAQTRWCQLKDKRPILQKELEELSAKKEVEGDRTLKFSLETARRFYRWLVTEDAGYLRWAWLHKFKTKEVEELLKICDGISEKKMAEDLGEELMKEIFGKNTEEMTGYLEDIEKEEKK